MKIFLLTSVKQEHRVLTNCTSQFVKDKYFKVAALLGMCQKKDDNTILEIRFFFVQLRFEIIMLLT